MKHHQGFFKSRVDALVPSTSQQFIRCRCAMCRTRNKSGLVWERHPDGVWRKRNNNQKDNK